MATKTDPALPPDVRELIARREEARAKVRLAEAEIAKHQAELSKVKAEILRADKNGVIELRYVMRW